LPRKNDSLAYAAGRKRSGSGRDAYAAVYRKAPVMADAFNQRWGVWAAGYGGSQTTDGNAALGSNGTTSSIGGAAVGATSLLAVHAGRFCIGRRRKPVSALQMDWEADATTVPAGAFVRHTVGPAYISAALAYGWQDITTDRTVTIAGIDQLRARFQRQRLVGPGRGRLSLCRRRASGSTPTRPASSPPSICRPYAEQAIVAPIPCARFGAKERHRLALETRLRNDNPRYAERGPDLRGRVAGRTTSDTDRNIGATFQTLPALLRGQRRGAIARRGADHGRPRK